MAVIYISSTYKDLIEERKAAARAVLRLEHRPFAMEDYVASDKRPVEKCIKDVQRCDAYVGIFAWRYGFVPGGYDKSITHLEYEAAKKARIPCLIFLLDEKAKWPKKNIAEGEELKKIKELRETLEKKHIRGKFKNADDLCGQVTAAVSLLNLKKSSQGKPNLGKWVSKMCDRFPQAREFWDFFQEKSKKCPKRPQFYFIHGDEHEGHGSLLERLMKTCLKEYGEKEWGKENASPYMKVVSWPVKGNLAQRQKQLPFNLMEKSNQWGESTDFTANALARLPGFDKRPLVIIKHNIYSSGWDRHSAPLIRWYIKNYWAKLECDGDGDVPLFLIFLNVKYQSQNGKGLMQKVFHGRINTKKRIRGQLQQLLRSSDEKCPCQLLKELTPVEREEVLDWFEENNIFEHEWERKEKADSIFRDKNNKVAKSKCMDEIEEELFKIINCQRRQQYDEPIKPSSL